MSFAERFYSDRIPSMSIYQYQPSDEVFCKRVETPRFCVNCTMTDGTILELESADKSEQLTVKLATGSLLYLNDGNTDKIVLTGKPIGNRMVFGTPGGKMQPCDRGDLFNTLLREIKEEVGLDESDVVTLNSGIINHVIIQEHFDSSFRPQKYDHCTIYNLPFSVIPEAVIINDPHNAIFGALIAVYKLRSFVSPSPTQANPAMLLIDTKHVDILREAQTLSDLLSYDHDMVELMCHPSISLDELLARPIYPVGLLCAVLDEKIYPDLPNDI